MHSGPGAPGDALLDTFQTIGDTSNRAYGSCLEEVLDRVSVTFQTEDGGTEITDWSPSRCVLEDLTI
jgi:hypothetical protein